MASDKEYGISDLFREEVAEESGAMESGAVRVAVESHGGGGSDPSGSSQ